MDLPEPDFFDRIHQEIVNADQAIPRGRYVGTPSRPVTEAERFKRCAICGGYFDILHGLGIIRGRCCTQCRTGRSKNVLGAHAVLREKRKRDAANVTFAIRDVHQPAGVLVNVVAQHVSDHVRAKGERRVVVGEVSDTEKFPIAAIAIAN
jgi:hypothetical protein